MYEKQKEFSRLKDIILTHGAGLRENDELPVHAKDRVDFAVELFKDSYAPKIVMSDKKAAKRMKEYAEKQNVSGDKILVEDQSTTTIENIQYTINRYMIPQKLNSLYLISNDWHGNRIRKRLAPKYLKDYNWEFKGSVDSRLDDDPQKIKDMRTEKFSMLSTYFPESFVGIAKKLLR